MIEYKNAENNIRHPNQIKKKLGENLIVQIMQIKFKILEQLFFVDLFHKFNFTPLVLIYRVPAQQLLLNLNLYWNYPKTCLIAKNVQDE